VLCFVKLSRGSGLNGSRAPAVLMVRVRGEIMGSIMIRTD
jgi:hypothetical protein